HAQRSDLGAREILRGRVGGGAVARVGTAVAVEIRVARIADPVPVEILLTRVGEPAAVVDAVRDAVGVLVRKGHEVERLENPQVGIEGDLGRLARGRSAGAGVTSK